MTFHQPGSRWFLARLKPNSAGIAERNLRQQGFATFLPVEEFTRRTKTRFVTGERPLFPGYIFVAFDPAQGSWRAVNSTSGVTRLVSFGKAPAPVPREAIAQLMRRCDAEGRLMPPKRLEPGDRITLSHSPLTDIIASIERITADRRVWVLMEIMGGQTRVAVPMEQIRAV